MSAVLRDAGEARLLRPIGAGDLDAMLSIENACYAFPWSRGNFVDSLAAGYWLRGLFGSAAQGLLGYMVAMSGADEMHLLNITVAPGQQGRGHARCMLDALVAHCAARRASKLWLEVRAGNARAQAIYRRYGFGDVGVRKGYYPAPQNRREDALVMSLDVAARKGLGRALD
jgi:[ribosomal protein S18]-alanine N-acetyltransferase